jgi:hypothetical protein
MHFKKETVMKCCICFLLLCSAANAELVAHYDLNINQPLRFEVFPNLPRFTWNLIGLAIDLYGTAVPEPGGVLVLLGLPLVFVRRRT